MCNSETMVGDASSMLERAAAHADRAAVAAKDADATVARRIGAVRRRIVRWLASVETAALFSVDFSETCDAARRLNRSAMRLDRLLGRSKERHIDGTSSALYVPDRFGRALKTLEGDLARYEASIAFAADMNAA
jgi:hypothetical protein